MNVWRRLKRLIGLEARYELIAELDSTEFFDDVEITPFYGSDDLTHELGISLSEPVRDGNSIWYFSLRAENGEVKETIELPAGSEFFTIGVTGDPQTFDIVTVDDEDDVIGTDTVTIRREFVEV